MLPAEPVSLRSASTINWIKLVVTYHLSLAAKNVLQKKLAFLNVPHL